MVAKLSAEAQNYFDETDERFKPIDLSWRKENGRLIARCGQRSYSFSENTLEDLVEIGNGPEKLGWTFFRRTAPICLSCTAWRKTKRIGRTSYIGMRTAAWILNIL